MITADELAFEKRTVMVEQYGMKLHAKVERSIARQKAAFEWRDYHGTRRPRQDDEIMVAWVCRLARQREMAVPVNLKDARWDYDRWHDGPLTETVVIDVIVPETPAQLEYLSQIKTVSGGSYSFYWPR